MTFLVPSRAKSTRRNSSASLLRCGFDSVILYFVFCILYFVFCTRVVGYKEHIDLIRTFIKFNFKKVKLSFNFKFI